MNGSRPAVRTHALYILLGCSLSLSAARLYAAESDTQFWPVLSLNHALADPWRVHLMLRAIFDDDVSNTNRLLVRGFVTRKARDGITLGLGYDPHYSLDSRSENRVWQ